MPDPDPPSRRQSLGSVLRGLFGRAGARLRNAIPPAHQQVSRRELLSGKHLREGLAGLFAPMRAMEQVVDATAEVERRAQASAPVPPPPPIIRPPGAVAEADFLAGCTRCGECISACPHRAILNAPQRYRAAAGTPMIDVFGQPCLMCADTPCISACTPNVLRRAEGAPVPKIGLARILTQDCLAWQGTTCSACHERCPVPGAIHVAGGRPQVNVSACTGCGICQHVCPAPRNAVAVLPLMNRPGIKG